MPAEYFINALLSSLDLVTYRSRDSKHYFMLLLDLLNLYFNSMKNDFKMDMNRIVRDLINRLERYESFEKKDSTLEDYNLVGLINLVNLIISNEENVLTVGEYQKLVVFVVEKLLFTFTSAPVSAHITNEVDLASHEKQSLNKC